MSKIWAELVRSGGTEDSSKVPSLFTLTENPTVFGRLSQPQPGTDHNFTHTSQYVIECLFISSTHFAISYGSDASGVTEYKIHDYSRNGTFLDGVLIGPVPRTISDGAEITLRYKDKVKIAYRFNVKAMTASTLQRPSYVEESGATSALMQQLTVLREEMQRLEGKYDAQIESNEALQKGIEVANRKVRQLEKGAEATNNELKEAKERIAVMEAHSSSLDARAVNLASDLEDALEDVKQLRAKVATQQAELTYKASQLDVLRKVQKDGNEALAEQQNARIQAEVAQQETSEQLVAAREKINQLIATNQAVQAMLVQAEADKDLLHDHLKTHKAMLISIQQRSVEQNKLHGISVAKVLEMVQLLGEMDANAKRLTQVNSVLTNEIDEFLSTDLASRAIDPPRSPEDTRGPFHETISENYVSVRSAVMPGTQTKGGPNFPGSEDSKTRFSYTQVPLSGHAAHEALPAVAIAVMDAIEEADESTDLSRSHIGRIEPPYSSETANCANDVPRQKPEAGEFLSQESHVRKSGTSPSKSSKQSSSAKSDFSQLPQQMSQDLYAVNRNLHTHYSPIDPDIESISPIKKRQLSSTNDDDDENGDSDDKDRYHDNANKRRKVVDTDPDTTFFNDAEEDNQSAKSSPPKSFDLDHLDADERNDVVGLREEDRQRTVDNTTSASNIFAEMEED